MGWRIFFLRRRLFSYLHIIAVSAIPAVMYFLSVGFFVYIRALKRGMKPDSDVDIPKVKTVLKEGAVFLVPVALLVLLLVRGFTPTYAVCIATLFIVVVSWFRKETRMGLKDILDALYIGAKNSISTASISYAQGLWESPGWELPSPEW